METSHEKDGQPILDERVNPWYPLAKYLKLEITKYTEGMRWQWYSGNTSLFSNIPEPDKVTNLTEQSHCTLWYKDGIH